MIKQLENEPVRDAPPRPVAPEVTIYSVGRDGVKETVARYRSSAIPRIGEQIVIGHNWLAEVFQVEWTFPSRLTAGENLPAVDVFCDAR